MNLQKNLKFVKAQLRKRNITIDEICRGSKHLQLRISKDGKKGIVTMAIHPNRRSLENMISDAKRVTS